MCAQRTRTVRSRPVKDRASSPVGTARPYECRTPRIWPRDLHSVVGLRPQTGEPALGSNHVIRPRL